MREDNNLERQLRELLSNTEPLTLQGLEDEIIKMLTCLRPLPIKMKRVHGVMYEHGFMIVDEANREKYGLEGEDIAYSWDVGNEHTNGLDKLFTVALYEALEYRSEKMLEALKIALSDLTFLEADRRKGNISEEEYRLVFDSTMKR